jgi:hypothetical protein
MSILTTIQGIPLYSTIEEALQWAKDKGLSGTHTHTYNNQVGYMGGSSHNIALTSLKGVAVGFSVSTGTPSGAATSSGSGSGGGGY